jgi:hypothetical protein
MGCEAALLGRRHGEAMLHMDGARRERRPSTGTTALTIKPLETCVGSKEDQSQIMGRRHT